MNILYPPVLGLITGSQSMRYRLFFRDSSSNCYALKIIENHSFAGNNYLYVYELHEFYLLEIAIIVVEGILIRLLAEVSYFRALAVSVAANLASMIIGMLVFG
jgi:hypothetical protein